MSAGYLSEFYDTYNAFSRNWVGGNGYDKENSYAGTHYICRGQKSYYYSKAQTGVWDFQMMAYYFPPFSSVGALKPFQNEELGAYSKLAEAIRNFQSFDASVFFGTLHQTVDMIVLNTKKVLTAYRDLKQGNWEQCLRTLGTFRRGGSKPPKSLSHKDLANFWLEIQYGWKPLLNDIEDGCKAIDLIKRRAKTTLRVQKSSYTEFVGDYLQNKGACLNTVKLKCILMEDPSTMAVLGLNSPATLVWEVLPWSFVVDWFVPVGEYLSNASFFSGFKRTILRTMFQSSEFESHHPIVNLGPLDQIRGGGYHVTNISLNRDFVDNGSIPFPSIKDMEKALSLGHLKNAAALVASQISLSR